MYLKQQREAFLLKKLEKISWKTKVKDLDNNSNNMG